ncbi:hypothetical protein MMPV_008938 [Pyropia vietnamensis]
MAQVNGATGGNVPIAAAGPPPPPPTADTGARIRSLAACLADRYTGLNPALLCILSGSAIFAADLSRALPFEHTIHYARASSYVGTASSGTITLSGVDGAELADRHVLVVEDIVDTGRTLAALSPVLGGVGATSVEVVTLLDKVEVAKVSGVPPVNYVAFACPNAFVVGYGMDINGRLRHLPFVGVYKE